MKKTKIIHLDENGEFAIQLKIFAEQEFNQLNWQLVSTNREVIEILETPTSIGRVSLILANIAMRNICVNSFIRLLQIRRVKTPVVLLTSNAHMHQVETAMKSGAIGYIPDSYSNPKILEAVKQVILNKWDFPKDLHQYILSSTR